MGQNRAYAWRVTLPGLIGRFSARRIYFEKRKAARFFLANNPKWFGPERKKLPIGAKVVRS